MNSFGIIDLVMFLGISQGIFLAITLSVVHNKNRSANKILSFILFIATIMLVGRVFHPRFSGIFFFRVAAFVDTLIFVFGPLIYTYVRRLTFNESPEYKNHCGHFIPALLHLAFFSWTLTYSAEEMKNMINNGEFNLIYFIVETLGLLSNLFYTIKSYRLVSFYKREEKNNLSYTQKVKAYLTVFLFGVSIFMILWVISYSNVYFMRIRELSFISYNLIWISIPIFIYIVGFFSLRQPEIFRLPKYAKKKNTKRRRLEGAELTKLKKALEQLIVEEKVYLNNSLTLKDLSEKLNTSTNNISWLLNNIHKCSFYDYINKYRVKEFIEKIQNGEHHRHTLLALSLDSGFNSKSTFNKAFKAEMNDTPTNYISNLNTA
ncbi:AraC family transcriptional regulator [Aquimarina sp. MMG016]|uniref:helix-turn-helix domain-containing protein n=1 Tax=Aquimarina sp. MMG016 TaxID=2822690 RepID=UPI001B39CF1D|nr:AraC family transcriptional regulator [Aquimarina sp. MMG016]MBQ4818956.1 helix-turn-helix transcriptional regulator [Aquimarina sp. MMG016]